MSRSATWRKPTARLQSLRRRLAAGVVAAALLAVVSSALGQAATLSAEEELGRRIYFGGTGTGGAMLHANFGKDSVRMPAILLPCANCHGHDGLGRPEGGVEPPNITWDNLTKPYGHRHPNGRRHPAFDADSAAGAIAGGVDPAGNALDPLMPRYEMSQDDMAALIAYLKRLGGSLETGLSEAAIVVGSVLPQDGPYGGFGRAVAATLKAYFDEVNAAGGVFGRRIELKLATHGADAAATTANARRLVEEDKAFAVVGAFAMGMERDLFRLFEDAGVPQVGPFTLFAGHGDLPAERIFHLLPGLSDQARALVDYAARHLDPAPRSVALLLSSAQIYDDVGRAVEDRAQRRGWPAPTVLRITGGPQAAAGHVAALAEAGVDTVLYFGPGEALAPFAAAAAGSGWLPRILLSGQAAGRQAVTLPEAFDGRVFLAYPNLPGDRTAAGAREFGELRRKYRLGRTHAAAQLDAYAAARVLVEALRRSGRSLSRGTLADALESLAKYETGLTPPVSFGPNRRVGSLGAHVLSVDLKEKRIRPASTWVRLD